jgi:2-oxoglutarate dehydrogenase E1 component
MDKKIFVENFTFVEEAYQKFLQNRNSVDQSWQDYFDQVGDDVTSLLADKKGPSWKGLGLNVIGAENFDISSMSKTEAKKPKKQNDAEVLRLSALNLIDSYRRYGHLVADIDPLQITQNPEIPQIDPKFHGINQEDLSKIVDLSKITPFGKIKASDLIAKLQNIYGSKIACQFDYIASEDEKNWLEDSLSNEVSCQLQKEEKIKILDQIIRATKFEQFLHKRFPGAKRFSIEGGESSIVCVEKIIDSSATSGVKKIVIGMAHRGRLNILTSVMKKPYNQMIAEFKGKAGIPKSITECGDVKYHMGYADSREIAGNKIDISLAFNPSHLEAVNPVVAGRIRAKQDQMQDKDRLKALAILIHGDAAFAGQGSVAENLMMNGIEAYNTGGVIHIIANNQIGFTANPKDSRSTQYASDLAKSIDAPIFHINGDCPESVAKISQIAVEYRQKFKKDIIIDIVCFRKYGHNESDEPMYTQPLMYSIIKNHPTLEEIYSKSLINDSVISKDKYDKLVSDFNLHLQEEFDLSDKFEAKEGDWLKKDWFHVKHGDSSEQKTAISEKQLASIVADISKKPEGFNINSKISRQLDSRAASVENNIIDWGTAEAIAFASLLQEGFRVRITGQDAGRGTFSHRHSVLHDGKNAKKHIPLNHLTSQKANYEVYDSFLSEYAVLGFEYGYSLSSPNALTIWEAQFGDFANGAQIIFDQFIASSEMKWLRKSNLVMLLPHGYEGQGPEHSSARLERYLQACADDNLRVVNITSPANFFHALRRQLHSKDRKPLVVMSPKSGLRHKLSTSKIEEFTNIENFRPLIADKNKDDKKIKKVIISSGKIYYDLFETKRYNKNEGVALIRLEQLYPFPTKLLTNELSKFKNAEIIWAQDEHKNMGAWSFVQEYIEEIMEKIGHKQNRLKYIGRVKSASPATGYASYHAQQQKEIINKIFN